MAQRWMQAKMMLAARHGTVISGMGSFGPVTRDDLPRGKGAASAPIAPKGRLAVKADSVQCFNTKRPKAWGSTRKAKIATRELTITFAASSRMICK